MGKVTITPTPGPHDPMFQEPPRSYNPHWGRTYLKSKLQPFATDQTPPVAGARLAPDGKWYVADPDRPGKYLLVVPPDNRR